MNSFKDQTHRQLQELKGQTHRRRQELKGTSTFKVLPGSRHPLGATPDASGVNFCVFSEEATSVELLLFDVHDDLVPCQTIRLDPQINRTFFFWHVYVQGLRPGAHYAYRVDGPTDLYNKGHRFNANKVLLDPYGRGHTNALWSRGLACGGDDNLATSMRSVVIDISDYDWEGDKPLNRPMSETIIYEMHPAGFTRSPTSGCKNPGTFAGIIEKIPYLKQLGVTAVEMLPVFAFDDKESFRISPVTGKPLINFWGYSPFGFFAPHGSYCVSPEEGSHIREFRDMVKAMHRAGLEVILDVVFNHTDEGDYRGPTISFKGLGNNIYYILCPEDRQYYMNYSGCGNTINVNHPVVEKFIVDSLEYWVREMHVDGFRFDEGAILCRGEDGSVMARPPVVWQIELSDALADTKIIAECWDAAGLYQVGYFPGYRWAEWNGRYRDTIRRFVRGDRGIVGPVASNIAGSADMFQSRGHLPVNTINFVTCHDGFTLNDLVSYNHKHNEANGEGNQDGGDDNLSWNCGIEGASDDPAMDALRMRQIKNFVTILMISQGVPMMLGGDEFGRTQQGNNNAYCQDNEINWFDWDLCKKNGDLVRFCSRMINFRKNHYILHRRNFITTQEVNQRGVSDMAWHGCKLYCPGWEDPLCGVLAITLGDRFDDPDLHIMLNMEDRDLDFEVPPVWGRNWQRKVDTSLPSPMDFVDCDHDGEPVESTYTVKGRSVVILISKDTGTEKQGRGKSRE